MAEITNHDLMLAIKELAVKLNVVSSDVELLKTDVADLKSDQKIMREEMNQNFRKLEEKIG